METETSGASAGEQTGERAGRSARRGRRRLSASCSDRRRQWQAGWLIAAAAVVGLARAFGPGPPPVVARAGPVFTAFLVPHIIAGLTALSSGAVILVARKGTRWHVRAGTTYVWAIAALTATAAGLTTVRGPRDLPVFGFGLLAVALAAGGRQAVRHPGVRPWRAWPGHWPHILAMSSSYTVIWTAFLADNAGFLPLISRLPTAVASGHRGTARHLDAAPPPQPAPAGPPRSDAPGGPRPADPGARQQVRISLRIPLATQERDGASSG
jgi:uncharacterized membrane protein